MRKEMREKLCLQLERVEAALVRIAQYHEQYERTAPDPDESPESRHAALANHMWDQAIVTNFQHQLANAVRRGAGLPEREPPALVCSKRPAR
jgi:hypothetical protein